MIDYKYKDIKKSYKKAGVSKGKVVFLESDLASLGRYETMEKNAITSSHLRTLMELVGKDGTIVVPTDSISLCNTNTPFNLEKTPSEMGIFSEYIRQQKKAVRSFHPFISFTAIGKGACQICKSTSRHAFGPETPMARMIDKNALFLIIGLQPRLTCSTVHQVEVDMGIPYRYVREYMHPVIRKKRIKKEPFYMYVWYYECDIKKNDKTRLWDRFKSKYEVKESALGRGKIYSYSMREFYKCAVDLFKDNLYILLEEIPKKKPYRKKM